MRTTTPDRSGLRKEAKQARALRFIQGLSLWAAILLFFVMQSVAARASEEPGTGELQIETTNATPKQSAN